MATRARGYVLECYWPGVTEETARAAAARAAAAVAELRGRGYDLTLRDTILMQSDETVFCLFDGLEEDVRAAGELAGIPFERVLESVSVAP